MLGRERAIGVPGRSRRRFQWLGRVKSVLEVIYHGYSSRKVGARGFPIGSMNCLRLGEERETDSGGSFLTGPVGKPAIVSI